MGGCTGAVRPSPLPPALLRLAAEQEGLVSSRQCDAHGVDRHRRARLVRAGTVAAVGRGVLDLSPAVPSMGGCVDPVARQRRRAAWVGLLLYGEATAVAVGPCALALHGVEGLPARLVPEVALPRGDHRRPRAGARVRCFEAGMRVVRVGRALVADPVVALTQAVCELPRRHAVAVLDSAVQQRLVAPDDLASVRTAARGRRGSARLHAWWDLVDGRAQSPPETWARLECVDAGIGPDGLQVPVRDRQGRVVARGDLGWRREDGRLLVVEIDGAGPHSTPEALYRDRDRQNAITQSGTTDLLRFTPRDVGTGRIPSAVHRWRGAPSERPPPRGDPAWSTGRRPGARDRAASDPGTRLLTGRPPTTHDGVVVARTTERTDERRSSRSTP